MAADLFETYAVTIVATMVLSSIFFVGDLNMMIYPLTIGGACILTSILRGCPQSTPIACLNFML